MRPLLMIPGPIEVSPAVIEAASGPPPSHVSPQVIEAFGKSLEMMREVFCASPSSQPFIVAGSGTLAMEMAVVNLIEPQDTVVVVNTGYFSDRMAEMLRRRGATIEEVRASAPGAAPTVAEVGEVLRRVRPIAVFSTHVDTSTGVKIDAAAIADLGKDLGILSIFDGVCATAGEEFLMQEWGADIYLTASQKAIGLPAGLALLMASERAMMRREELKVPPPMSMDFHQWLPIMKAYEERRPSYFATPATTLIMALQVGLKELVEQGMANVFERHQSVADGMRAAWLSMGLETLTDPHLVANTLSAIRYPSGLDATLVSEIAKSGVIVAPGLHPECKTEYFRVGHMGYTTLRNDWLESTVLAVSKALSTKGHDNSPDKALEALRAHIR